ncbi:MAG: DHH family phosphoesterase, partial [Pseudomonadota bacterium]
MNLPVSAGSFLDVERSARGRVWSLRTADDRLARAHAQRLGVAEVLGRILAGRSVPLDLGERFLNPSLREDMPDPSSLADMDRAVGRVVRTVEAGKPVGIFGDYDVDGAASTALLGRYLTGLGLRVLTHIPDRMTEGYGPNIAALRALAAEGADVIVTVVCGTAATNVLAEAAGVGLVVVVLDHHEPPDAPPPTAGH